MAPKSGHGKNVDVSNFMVKNVSNFIPPDPHLCMLTGEGSLGSVGIGTHLCARQAISIWHNKTQVYICLYLRHTKRMWRIRGKRVM